MPTLFRRLHALKTVELYKLLAMIFIYVFEKTFTLANFLEGKMWFEGYNYITNVLFLAE